MRYLKTNTATTITVGPFLDKTDGITPETAITVTGVHITFMVDNAGSPTLAIDSDATASGGNNDMVHITNDDAGYYSLELTAAQTNYLGGALLSLNVVGTACPVFHEFTILPANIYDSMIAGTDLFDVSTTQFNGSAVTASSGRPEVNMSHIAGSAVSTSTAQLGVNVVNFGGSAGTFASGRPEVNTTHAAGTAWGSGAITAGSIAADAITAAKIADGAIDLATFAADAKALMGVVAFGTAQSVTGTTIRLASAETFADDEIIGATVIIRSATTGAGQARVITDYVSATDTATVDTWTTTPTGTITYVVIATAPASTSVPMAVNVTQWLGTACATPTVAGVPEVDVTHNNGSAITAASGIQEVKVASIAANAITAAAIASDAITDAKVASDVTIASVTGAVGSVTGNVGGNVTGSVGSVAAGGITASSIATGAIDADALAADAVAEIADGVWDEATSGHSTAGSTGKALTDASSAGDPWSTSLPGAYGAGTAGYLIGTNLDATVSSRLATSGYTAPLSASGTRTALGLASANLDTQLGDLPTATENADALLARNVAGGSDGTRTVSQAFYVLRNKVAISAGTLTVYGTDDSTPSFTASVTTAAGDPVSAIDPA